MAVEHTREDTDVELARKSLAELRQELGGGLDARPVVLVDDEQARFRWRRSRRRTLPSRGWRAPHTNPVRRTRVVAGHRRLRRADPGDARARRAARGARARRRGGDDSTRRPAHPACCTYANRTAATTSASRTSTPVSYRWMGITPTLPMALERMERPDVVHVSGSAILSRRAWLRGRAGAASPTSSSRSACSSHACARWRLKRALDATLYRGGRGRRGSCRRQLEREAEHAGGRRPGGSRARTGQRLPQPGLDAASAGCATRRARDPRRTPIVLYVGRIASGKGVEHLLAAVRELRDAHLVLVGPDDRHGAIRQVRTAQRDPGPPDACTPSERRSSRLPPPLRRGERALPALRRRELRHGCGRGGRRRHARRRHRPLRHRGFLLEEARRSSFPRRGGGDRGAAARAGRRGAAPVALRRRRAPQRGACRGST